MNYDDFKSYCMQKVGVTETFPFDEETLVFKVSSKMFALTNISKEKFDISLKCEPLLAISLRNEFNAIKPGYHLNKTHWITIDIDGTIEDDKIKFFIDLSYDLVVKGLKKSEKEKLYLLKT